MAILKLENGQTFTELPSIGQYLSVLGVQLHYWPMGDIPLLQKAHLDDAQKEIVLQSLDQYFESLKDIVGYQFRDLIVLHPDIPNLDALLAKFSCPHIHFDDEARYILEGEGIFGFVCPDGSQMELTVKAQEYINIPAATEHWFYLTPQRRIKAIRYFCGKEGWVPEYTETLMRMHPIAVPL